MQDEQMAVRVAWLYFIEGWTQGEIADALSTNRLRVNRMLNDARRSGLVTFTLNSRLTSCVELERALIAEFGLKHAIVLPSPRDPEMVRPLLGQAAADHIAHLLGSSAIREIATGWGSTIREVVRHLPPMQRPDVFVSSALGGLTRGLEVNTFDIAAGFGRQLGAEIGYLAAPVYAGSSEAHDAILSQDPFRQAFARAAACDLILLSVGDMTDSLLVRYALPAEVEVAELIAAGACGDLMGQLIDRDGQPIDHPLNRRCITLPLEKLRDIPHVLIISGGLYKAEAMAAVLRGGWGNVIVSDEDTMRRAMAIARERPGR
jgi:DNA-binding transcriptional regulator LsrR (DeoR family)